MTGVFWTIAVASCVALALIIRRVWPVMLGKARPDESRAQTLNRWNMYMVPMLRKHLTEDMLVGLAGTFQSDADAQEYTAVTWSLHPSIMPDVDYIALAPSDEDGRPTVVGFIGADDLREHLGGRAQSQEMFGHKTWIYVWPDDADYDAVVASCATTDEFMARHGLSLSQSLEAE